MAGLCQNGSQFSDLPGEFKCHSLTSKNHFCREAFGFVKKKHLKNVNVAFKKIKYSLAKFSLSKLMKYLLDICKKKKFKFAHFFL